MFIFLFVNGDFCLILNGLTLHFCLNEFSAIQAKIGFEGIVCLVEVIVKIV